MIKINKIMDTENAYIAVIRQTKDKGKYQTGDKVN